MPLPEYTGTLDTKRAAHLLRRACFGASPDKINNITNRNLTPAQAVAILFRTALPDVPPPINPETGTDWLTGEPDSELDFTALFKQWFIGQMMSPGIDSSSDLNLAYAARERLVFFLHSHFTTIADKVSDSLALYYQNQLFRFFSLDALNADPDINFKTLTVKICIDNAMLKVLDGTLNVKGSVNENYARELLELYSIGKGLPLPNTIPDDIGEGDYLYFTEQDVQAAAKVLSGWAAAELGTGEVLDLDTNLPRGIVKGSPTNASAHDNDPKQFSARFGNAVITPTVTEATEESALEEIQQLIDLIYDQPETARNICRKIYRFYVWGPHTEEEIAAIEPIIDDMAITFENNNYKLQPVIEELLKSQHFYDSIDATPANDNFGGIIKSPLDLVVGTLRLFDYSVPNMAVNATNFYEITGQMLSTIQDQAMNFYDPSDVAGYEAYHQFPLYHRFWITPNTLTKRYLFIRTLFDLDNGFWKINLYDYIANTPIFNSVASDASALVATLGLYFFPLTDQLDFDDVTNSGLTTERLRYFRDSRLLFESNQTEWQSKWPTYDKRELHAILANLFNGMLQSPEFQLA